MLTTAPPLSTLDWAYRVLQEGRSDLAAAIFKAAIKQADNSRAQVGLGLAELTQGQYEAAVPRLRAHLPAYPVSLDAVLADGETAERVLANLAGYVRLHPEDEGANEVLGQLASPTTSL